MAEVTLWKYRTKNNLKLREVAEATGVSIAQLNKIENNKVSPTLDTLEKIAMGLKCSMNELYFSNFK